MRLGVDSTGDPSGAATPGPALSPGLQLSPGPVPRGNQCTSELERLGARYEALDELRGVETPVDVEGPIGGVRYTVGATAPLRADCRLVVALHRLGPGLLARGVTEVRYSGAYVYRTTHAGNRLSLHAHGLAIDVHGFVIRGERYTVKHDFARNRQAADCRGLPPVNEIACWWRQTGMFRELLTPDSDADHHDHIHIALSAQ